MIVRPMNPAVAGERAFVLRSWVESYATSALAKVITHAGNAGPVEREWRPSPAYWRTWNALVSALADRGRVLVAEDAGLIAGFMCWEPWDDFVAIHYIYTRLSYRKQGVARTLLGHLPAGPAVFTHRSRGVRGVPETWRFSMAPLFGVFERKDAA